MHYTMTLHSNYTSLTRSTTDGYDRGIVKTSAFQKIGCFEEEKAVQYRNIKNSHSKYVYAYTLHLQFTRILQSDCGSRKSDPAQKWYMSEARPSFHKVEVLAHQTDFSVAELHI